MMLTMLPEWIWQPVASSSEHNALVTRQHPENNAQSKTTHINQPHCTFQAQLQACTMCTPAHDGCKGIHHSSAWPTQIQQARDAGWRALV